MQQALAAFPRSDYAVALSSIDRALELQSDDTLTLNIRACVLGNLNRFHESLQTCDRALHIKPDYEDALINRGVGRLGKCD